MLYQIKHRFDGRVLYECEADSMSKALQNSINSGADLSRADLSWANLSGADLSGADLSWANLRIYQAENFTCYIQPDQIRIGCQCHSVEQWQSFTDERISKMEDNALKFYRAHKAAIVAIHETLNTKGKP